MSNEPTYLTDLLRRLDRQDQDSHKLAVEFSHHKASVEAYQTEMRRTVDNNFNHFKDVTRHTQATCDKMEALVKEATEAAHLAANSKSKTEKAYDKAMLAAGTSVLFIVTAFGAPWLASKEDFWDTVWLAVKGAVKAKVGP
jgi:hypothetical protein